MIKMENELCLEDSNVEPQNFNNKYVIIIHVIYKLYIS